MFPTLIDLGTVDLPMVGEIHLFLPMYGVLFATGALVAWVWFMRRARSLGLPEETLFNLGFYTLLGGILGAKLTLILVDWRTYLRYPEELWGTLRAAGVLMGGVVIGAVVFTLYARRHGLPLYRLTDAAVAPLALAQGIGRLGCFSAGCCWGVPASAGGFSVTFTNPVAHDQTGVPLGVPLVPIQAIQMVNDLVLALVLTWLWRRQPRPEGTVFWLYVVLYSASRGIIEFWRGDARRGVYFGETVSTSQLIAVAGVVIGLWMLAHGRSRLRQARAEA